KAIVTSTTGAEGIAVTDRENIMLADDPVSFIQKTENLLQDKAMSLKMGENALEFARIHYDHLHLAEKLTLFYQQHNSK
ncbi:MAG TPA: hypothetical protein PLW67_10925, partial [Prolixibacteraceae bacterium]|nr:hypothetical protein [Prolixibacteraceae bacterium]